MPVHHEPRLAFVVLAFVGPTGPSKITSETVAFVNWRVTVVTQQRIVSPSGKPRRIFTGIEMLLTGPEKARRSNSELCQLKNLMPVARHAPQQFPRQPQVILTGVVDERLDLGILLALAPLSAWSEQTLRVSVASFKAQPLGAICGA